MEDKDSKPRQLSCLSRGPGPAYLLPTLVGYNGHDPSRYRNPAYTMGTRTGMSSHSMGPGPQYNIEYQTQYGLQKTPAFTIGFRKASILGEHGPGPGAYSPEKCPPMNHSLRPAAFTLKPRINMGMSGDGPGPIYMLPSCIGPRIPDKNALGAFSIGFRHGRDHYDAGPGPAAYGDQNYDLVKKRLPAYSLGYRPQSSVVGCGPGPIYYPQFNPNKRTPMYSFGVKHSDCAPPAITECDDE